MTDSREEGERGTADATANEAQQESASEVTEQGNGADSDPAASTARRGGEDAGEEGAGDPDEVERLRSELNELNDRHLRLAAEFDNFRRRSRSQMGESGIRAQAALVEKLLDVLDDFDRVSSMDPDQATVASVLEGVELVERKLHRTLEDAGLEAIDPEDEPFDPNSMEAILRESAESEEEDETVSRVLQRGFRFRGHLVRPARVGVRKYEA